jgi:hypothetical protein
MPTSSTNEHGVCPGRKECNGCTARSRSSGIHRGHDPSPIIPAPSRHDIHFQPTTYITQTQRHKNVALWEPRRDSKTAQAFLLSLRVKGCHLRVAVNN